MHRARTVGATFPFTECVARWKCNPGAHGAIVREETCQVCHCTSLIAINGPCTERSRWLSPREIKQGDPQPTRARGLAQEEPRIPPRNTLRRSVVTGRFEPRRHRRAITP